jgi:hypothetical protein
MSQSPDRLSVAKAIYVRLDVCIGIGIGTWWYPVVPGNIGPFF